MFTTEQDRSVLRTKAREVTITSRAEDQPGRQQLLKDMFDNPELVEQIYLQHDSIRVVFNGKAPMTVGVILSEYIPMINGHPTKVRSWKITGGYPLQTLQEEPVVTRLAYFGLNLEIDVL